MSTATTEISSECYSYSNIISTSDCISEGAGPQPPPPCEPSVKKTSQPSTRPKVGSYVVFHPPQQEDFDVPPPTFEEAVSSSLIPPSLLLFKTNNPSVAASSSSSSLKPPSMNRSMSDTIYLQSKRLSSSPTLASRQKNYCHARLMQDNSMSSYDPPTPSFASFDMDDSSNEKELHDFMASTTSESSLQSDQQERCDLSGYSKRGNHYASRTKEYPPSNSHSEEMENLIIEQEMILKSIQKQSRITLKDPPPCINSGPGRLSSNDFSNDLKPPSLVRYQTHSPSTNTTTSPRLTSDYMQNLICWKCNQRYKSTLKSTNEMCLRCYSKNEPTDEREMDSPVEPKSFHDHFDNRHYRHPIHLSRRDPRPNQ